MADHRNSTVSKQQELGPSRGRVCQRIEPTGCGRSRYQGTNFPEKPLGVDLAEHVLQTYRLRPSAPGVRTSCSTGKRRRHLLHGLSFIQASDKSLHGVVLFHREVDDGVPQMDNCYRQYGISQQQKLFILYPLGQRSSTPVDQIDKSASFVLVHGFSGCCVGPDPGGASTEQAETPRGPSAL